MGYNNCRKFLRCSASCLFVYFTSKSSTTRVKTTSREVCFHSAGVWHIGSWPNFSRWFFRRSLAIFPAWFRPDIPFGFWYLSSHWPQWRPAHIYQLFSEVLKKRASNIRIFPHGDTIVEIFQVHSHEFRPWCGDGSGQEYFFCQQWVTLCGRHPIKLKAIPSYSQAYMVSFLFMWTYFSLDPSIC